MEGRRHSIPTLLNRINSPLTNLKTKLLVILTELEIVLIILIFVKKIFIILIIVILVIVLASK